jgi:hypothetical protein
MTLSNENVIELCINELQSMRTRASANCRFTQEVVRRAIVEQTDEGWSMLEQCFNETIRTWVHSHPRSELALQRDTEENYIAQTFSRFRYATRSQKGEFATLTAVLSYLHATVSGAIIDTLRFLSHSYEDPFPESAMANKLTVGEAIEIENLWKGLQKLLYDERERRVFYLLYSCGLKPRKIVTRWPQEFPDVKEIYRLHKNVVERLTRDNGQLRYLWSSD